LGIWSMALLIIGMVLSLPIGAQTFTVRLLNGETGKRMPNRKVTVRWVNGFNSSEVLIDKNGVGLVEASQGEQQFLMTVGPKPGNEPYRVAYLDCNDTGTTIVQVKRVTEAGFVPGNKCGRAKAVPKPGEIIFWAKPIPWWLPDFQ
jgi:hypothetical protein